MPRAGSTNAPPNIQRSPAASAVFLHKCRGILLGCWALYRAGVTVEASARVRGGRPSEKKIQLVPAFSLVSRYCTLITRLYLHLTELSINGVHQIITVVFNGTWWSLSLNLTLRLHPCTRGRAEYFKGHSLHQLCILNKLNVYTNWNHFPNPHLLSFNKILWTGIIADLLVG